MILVGIILFLIALYCAYLIFINHFNEQANPRLNLIIVTFWVSLSLSILSFVLSFLLE